jgi:hypothetical protein
MLLSFLYRRIIRIERMVVLYSCSVPIAMVVPALWHSGRTEVVHNGANNSTTKACRWKQLVEPLVNRLIRVRRHQLSVRTACFWECLSSVWGDDSVAQRHNPNAKDVQTDPNPVLMGFKYSG